MNRLLLATWAVLLPLSAHAADMQLPTKAPMAPRFSTWTGCYGGVHVGWGWGAYQQTLNDGNVVPADTQASGAVFGGQIGCDYQVSNFVLGVQGMLSGTSITDTGFDSVSDDTNRPKTDALGSVTGRLGMTLGNNWLPYIKGGWGYRHERDDWTGGHLTSFDQGGWTFGGGLEYMLTPQWSLFADYMHYNFDTITTAIVGGDSCGAGPPCGSTASNAKINVFRVGANVRFSVN
jgi:outer membrane immunogenic protein